MNKSTIATLVILAVVLIGGFGIYYFYYAQPQEPDTSKLYSYVPGDPFITNIHDSKALLRVTIVLVLNTDRQMHYLKENEYILRDTVISVLRSKTEEELRMVDATDVLREDLVNLLRDELGMDYLVTIYFNDFVLQ